MFVIIAVTVTVTAKPHLARVVEDYGILYMKITVSYLTLARSCLSFHLQGQRIGGPCFLEIICLVLVLRYTAHIYIRPSPFVGRQTLSLRYESLEESLTRESNLDFSP